MRDTPIVVSAEQIMSSYYAVKVEQQFVVPRLELGVSRRVSALAHAIRLRLTHA